MPSLLAADALLPSGWARAVLLEWDDAGVLTRVAPGSAARHAPHASGPVLPGMVNVHSHAFQRAMAGLAETRGHPTDDFWTWREEMYRLVGLLEPDEVEAIARQLYIEMLKHGYTAVAEFHYLHNDRDGRPYAQRSALANRIVAAAGDAGIALTLLPVLYAYGGFGHKMLNAAQRRFASDPASIMALVGDLAATHLPHPLLKLGIAPHSVRAVDALMLTELVAAAEALDRSMPIHMHISEQVREVSECIATHGTTPLAWVCDLVEVDARWCFIHATHATQLEMRRLAPTGAGVGLCPTTEANLGDGIFDFVPWFEARRPWAVGGDSHVSVSPFEELRTLEYSQRLRQRVRNVAADEVEPDVAANLWRQSAHGGARSLAQPAGELAVGRRADLVVLDGGHLDFESLDAAAALGVAIFGVSANRVRDVFVAGAPVVEAGRHPREGEAALAYRAALKRLRSRP
ncbi:MAG TPA: formimidoylglutamate deiminase [Usitatibacter sp.]|nr:formimidoylglutamate deiminase [Usitatibacter sp.]